MGFRRKRGSAQVEAAIILPLVILAAVWAIWLLTLFYSQTAVRSGIHLALRCGAGISTDTILCSEEAGMTGLYSSFTQGDRLSELLEEKAAERVRGMGLYSGPSLSGKSTPGAEFHVLRLNYGREYRFAGLMKGIFKKDGTSFQYNIDEAQWIRNGDWIADEIP